MIMRRGDPRYLVNVRRTLFAEEGTELKISPLLEGIRSLSGEKIQWYLASELRDGIRNAQVRITVIDKLARKPVSGRAAAVRRALAAPISPSPLAVWRGICRIVSDGTDRGLPCRPYAGGTRVVSDIGTLPGPLHSVLTSPATSTITVKESRRFRALPRDRSRRRVEEDLTFAREIVEGGSTLSSTADQEITFAAPDAPVLVRLSVTASQSDIRCSAEALVTVTDSLDISVSPSVVNARGLPGHVRTGRGGTVALAIRCRPQLDCREQRPPRLCLRYAQSGAPAALSRAAVR